MSIIIAITEQEEEDDGTFLLGPNIIVFYWSKTVLYKHYSLYITVNSRTQKSCSGSQICVCLHG